MNLKKPLLFICVILIFNSVAMSYASADTHTYITRAGFAHMLCDMLTDKGIIFVEDNKLTFNDVPQGHESYADISALYSISAIRGDGNGSFRPDDFIKISEAAAMVGRLFLTDDTITERYGQYPYGYLKCASEYGIEIANIYAADEKLSTDLANDMIKAADSSLKIYDAMEKLGCDAFNGEVYIDYYPKSWQGFEEKPVANSNGYFKILPAKLLYSYDRVNWQTLYEDIDGKRVYSNLPDDIDIDGANYAWHLDCFVNAPFDVNKKYYSYDNIQWFRGEPEKRTSQDNDIRQESFVMGINGEGIICDGGLYFWHEAYKTNKYYSKRYATTFSEPMCNIIWVSENLEEWIGIKIPDDMLFFTGVGLEPRANAIIIDGAVEFTQEEKAFLDNEEKIAAKLNKSYDRPRYKPEKYMLSYSQLHELLD